MAPNNVVLCHRHGLSLNLSEGPGEMCVMHGWDDPQARVLADDADMVLVMGGPGTGRTSLCLEIAARHVASGGLLSDVLVLAQTRPSAQALRTALVRRLAGAHLEPQVMTVHALARRIVASPSRRLLTAPEQEFRMRELLAARDMSDWPDELRTCAGTAQFASDVRVMAARLRQEGCDPQDLTDAGVTWGVPEWRVLGPFLADYLDVLDLEGTLDYAEAVHRARIALTRPGADIEVRSRIKLLICDDVVECDSSQIRFLSQIARCHIPCVLTADPDQTIYGFRGAVAERLDEVIDEFPDVSVHHLATNYRNSQHIAEVVESLRTRMPAVPSSSQLRRRANHSAVTEDGTVAAVRAPSMTRLVRKIAGTLRHAHVADGVAWRNMAVVTRHGGELGIIATVLAAEDIPVLRSRDEHALSDINAVTHIVNALAIAVALASGRQPSDRDVATLLSNPLAGIDRSLVHRLETWCRLVRGIDIDWPLLGELGADPMAAVAAERGNERPEDGSRAEVDGRAEEAGKEGSETAHEAYSVPPGLRALAQPLAMMVQRVQRAADLLRSDASCHEALWALWQGSSWTSSLRSRALAGDSAADRDLDGLCSLFDMADGAQTMAGIAGARRLIEVVRQEQIPADRARESDEDRDGVSVVTAHRVKGREFDVVAVCGLEEGNWPADNHTGSLVRADRWSPDSLVAAPGWSENLRAETRLLLVACSRARRQLLLCTVESAEEGKRPSGLVAGLPHVEDHVDSLNFTSLTELVGELRRVVVDNSELPGVRAEAQALLDDLRVEKHRGRQLVPQADPSTWWCQGAPHQADVAGEIELSASHIGELLTCPRRWFMTRRAGASSGSAFQASIGSLVHRICAENMGHWSLPGALPELGESWSESDVTAEWQRNAKLADAKAAVQRFDGWLQSRHRQLIGTEVRVDGTIEVPSGTARVRGSIDRLERDAEGACYVVDLKTGASQSEETKRSHRLQIGVYQAVVASGGVKTIGPKPVSGAELVHLQIGAGKGKLSPKVDHQSGLADVPWPNEIDPVDGCRNWIEASVDKALRIVISGDYPAVVNRGCGHCPAKAGCPALVPMDPATARSNRRRNAL